MKTSTGLAAKCSKLLLRLIILAVAIDGLIIIASTLAEQFLGHHFAHIHSSIFLSLPLIGGLTLLYLSFRLQRRKRTALGATLLVYGLIIIFAFIRLALQIDRHFLPWSTLRDILLPVVISGGLFRYRREFVVKSDLDSFRQSLRFIVVALGVAFVYGVSGFLLMDDHDFHREISLTSAVHYTVDQLGLTTNQALVAHTGRGRVFVYSLSVVSIGALVYAAISLFQPLRMRLSNPLHNREFMERLLETSPASSEDFFKLWPRNKLYFFDGQQKAGLAVHIQRGVALVVGDPAGSAASFSELLQEFEALCYGNDWRVAFIHTAPQFSSLYKKRGYKLQKIGQEAIIDTAHFQKYVATNKYFRHIDSKFRRAGYTTELFVPPHDAALIDRLRIVSGDWLKRPGRTERGFMMGYFSSEYMSRCPVMVARDSAGTIQAFLNQVPSFDKDEANFDLLRHTQASPGNINDYLLMNFIAYAAGEGFERFNMGLSPLAGLEEKGDSRSVIDSALRFAYANGDRLYSFSGLHRFKAKYDPQWSDRYIVYRGGPHSFTKVLNALNKALRVKL